MKYFYLTLLISVNLFSNHVNWYNNFEKAHQIALKENKNIMLLLIKKECSICKNTIISTFSNQKYIDIINKKFVSVLVTKNQKSSYPIEMLYTNEYPSVFFLDKYELFLCDPIKGLITPSNFKVNLDKCN